MTDVVLFCTSVQNAQCSTTTIHATKKPPNRRMENAVSRAARIISVKDHAELADLRFLLGFGTPIQQVKQLRHG